MNKNDCIIRLERKEEHRRVENLVREAFWNVYRPGCSEHYVLNQMRDDPAFVSELDFVMEKDGELIGQNVFVNANIKCDDGTLLPIMAMGPICIAPEYKRQGYGKILLDYTLEKAKEYGCKAVCFEGNIDFYGKSGFTFAREYGIRYHDIPEGMDDSFFCVRNWKRAILTVLPANMLRPGFIWLMIMMSRNLIKVLNTRKSLFFRDSCSK